MRNVFAILICIVMCLSACGCDNAEQQKEDAKAALTNILQKEQSFTIHNPYIGTLDQKLENFEFPTEVDALFTFVPMGYTFADFDADGVDELLVADMKLQHFLFLRYEDEQVIGYMQSRIRPSEIKTDGSFRMFGVGGYDAISTISFAGDSSEITHQAYKDESNGTYLINESPVSSDEFDKYVENWENTTTKVAWKELG